MFLFKLYKKDMSHQIKILRAARAYLGLDQSEVSEMTEITPQTISSLENGKTAATERTLRRLRQTYEERGIVFTAHGFEYQPYKTAIFESFLDILTDAESILRKGDEILLHCADERRNIQGVSEAFQRLREKGIRIRMICEESNSFITGQPQDYRWISSEQFANSQVEVIYKDKYVFHFQDEGKNIFLMTKNKVKAETAKKQFEYNWKRGSKSWEKDQTI